MVGDLAAAEITRAEHFRAVNHGNHQHIMLYLLGQIVNEEKHAGEGHHDEAERVPYFGKGFEME